MALSPQRLAIYLYSAHRAVVFAIAQLSCIYSQHLLLYLCPVPYVGIYILFDLVVWFAPLMAVNARVFCLNFSHLIRNGYAIQVYRHQYTVTYPRTHKLWTLSLMLIRE